MANMEFLSANFINTTSMIALLSYTDGAQFLFDKKPATAYATSGYNSTTAATITITFATATVISVIAIQNHNLSQFRAFYNGVTASSLGIVTGNSAASTYLSFSSVTVSSVTIQMDNTIAGGVEKSVGELIISDRQIKFERNPAINDFKPVLDRKQVIHEMPDGGVVAYNIADKYRATLSWDFITSAFHSSLLGVYESGRPVVFIPEPTTSAWDGKAYEVLWVGDFDFNYSSNVRAPGYGGKILLRQTPSR
jgi:hypothetical protein